MVCPNNPADCTLSREVRNTLVTRDDDTAPEPTPHPLPNPIVRRGNPDLHEILSEIVNATKSAKSRLEHEKNHPDIRKRQESTESTSTVTSTHTHSALTTFSQTTTVSTEAQETETETTTGTSTISTSTVLATVTKTGTPNMAGRVGFVDTHAVAVMSWVSLVYLVVLILRVVKIVN
ncbi:hypothetical protein TWF730_001009 [Orbilia blumenaviensis]|uniref:Uncharacterized protein n=1 Tax=Orbilia blumenaviensis TaxID=1796055 RepID=A0AAV9VUH1_9PEZI